MEDREEVFLKFGEGFGFWGFFQTEKKKREEE